MYKSMKQELRALKRITIGIFAIATAELVHSQTAQAKDCPKTLGDIQWATPNSSSQLTVVNDHVKTYFSGQWSLWFSRLVST